MFVSVKPRCRGAADGSTIDAGLARLGVDRERTLITVDRFANTAAGTIPIAYHEALEQGRAKQGDLVCFVGLGSGLNWGAVLYRC